MIFSSLQLTTGKNAAPTWSGTIPFNFPPHDQYRLSTDVKLSKVGEKEYEKVTLDLWVKSKSINKEATLSLSGVPYSVRNITKIEVPTVISPDISLFDDSEQYLDTSDSYRFVRAELFNDAINGLFEKVPWSVKIGPDVIRDLPVVTEASPVLVLNGSLLEQLAELLKLMSPTDLYGQTLSYYVNHFNSTISIISPVGNNTNTVEADINDIKPTDLSVQIEQLSLPSAIYMQESEGALFRSPEHLEAYGVTAVPYSNKTSTTVVEGLGDQSEISSSEQGMRYSVGGLVLSESSRSVMSKSATAGVSINFGRGTGGSDFFSSGTYNFVASINSDSSTETAYTYLVGPPYPEVLIPYNKSMDLGNLFFTKSSAGSRQQISRDIGSVTFDKDSHPDYLYTTDGIRILKVYKKEVETSSTTSMYNLGGQDFAYPGDPTAGGDSVITETTEVFGYSNVGQLISTRVEAVTQEGEKYTVRDSTTTLTPMKTGEMMHEITKEKSSEYFGGYASEFLVSKSATSVSSRAVPTPTDPTAPTSVMASADGAVEFEEKLLIRNVQTDDDPPTGTLYVSVDTLTIPEMEQYLKTCYRLQPELSYKVDLESEFIDARGILGGILRLTGAEAPSRPEAYEIVDDGALEYQQQQASVLLGAMEEAPFCVSAVSMSWNGDEVPKVYIRLCQLI